MLIGSAKLGLRTRDSTSTGKSYATAQQQLAMRSAATTEEATVGKMHGRKIPTTPRKEHHACYLAKSGPSARLVKAKISFVL